MELARAAIDRTAEEMRASIDAQLSGPGTAVERITIAPRRAAGLHVHNGPVFGSVETGSVVYQIEGEAAAVLRPGDVFHEPEGARIARFDAGEDGVTFLGYFLLGAGEAAEIEFPGG
ncbi:hypothetical protein [Actinomadura sp. NPDC000929]|uniref:hypothetical protein n=1 Tax=Actinomadura sp. NPDC000929 TaxID=3154517 RepID=UPI00339147C8